MKHKNCPEYNDFCYHKAMSDLLDDILRPFDFAFPPELIAQSPASPRDSARLVVFNRASKKTDWLTFDTIGNFLPPHSILVLNQTKVIPARLRLARSTGGKVDVLYLGIANDCIRVFANKKLRDNEVLQLNDCISFTVIGRNEKEWLIRPSCPLDELPSVLEEFGVMPLPPYIKHSPLTRDELKEEYQSVFAKEPGSIAAPTASLHFTKELLDQLQQSGIHIAYVTLHVHLGTFSPLTLEQWETGTLHAEYYSIDEENKKIIERAKSDGKKIIAVGTTAARTLESAADEAGKIARPSGTTQLFIRDGYTFRMVDGLITNFHVPQSSLLMLVSAFAGREEILTIYREAIERKFRLFSFGDAMLIV
ncbi:MAG: S-adenosylmethionine/tRNA-ribosyltransferase-isomerase, S-adenosylmethionine:tRNA [Candidatus Peribacteria bacterium]|nr:S-adenosylmethionine/tRNA-ribosyltransferase-isomerase, S-adenosylmethionine:tRNA [Candidatus Peribacteria bacterium]